MKCKVCGSHEIEVIYNGKIRDGGVDSFTKDDVPVYECKNCNVIWHDNVISDLDNFYSSTEYRAALDGSAESCKFYENHDGAVLDTFKYTGTKIFRDKVVADVGCGAGAWLDFVRGAAKEVIGIDPAENFRNTMKNKGFVVFPYAEDAKKTYRNAVDVVTSFDVIEHVEDPENFLRDIYDLIRGGGVGIVGTPTNTPVTSKLVGDDYNKVILYQTQHLWILSKKSFELISKRVGFSRCEIKYFQRFGITNLFAWLQYRKPLSVGTSLFTPKKDVDYSFVTETLDAVYRNELAKNGLADYMVAYLYK